MPMGLKLLITIEEKNYDKKGYFVEPPKNPNPEFYAFISMAYKMLQCAFIGLKSLLILSVSNRLIYNVFLRSNKKQNQIYPFF